jgi:hypothetical protein
MLASPDETLQLPVDELAILVLRDRATAHEVNEYNRSNHTMTAPSPDSTTSISSTRTARYVLTRAGPDGDKKVALWLSSLTRGCRIPSHGR